MGNVVILAKSDLTLRWDSHRWCLAQGKTARPLLALPWASRGVRLRTRALIEDSSGCPLFVGTIRRSVWVVRRHETDLTMEAERALPGPVKSRRHEASSWVPANTHNAH
jgi:hypothetical protein